eukprot:9481723-Pyramimonas_sp.AAC.1
MPGRDEKLPALVAEAPPLDLRIWLLHAGAPDMLGDPLLPHVKPASVGPPGSGFCDGSRQRGAKTGDIQKYCSHPIV